MYTDVCYRWVVLVNILSNTHFSSIDNKNEVFYPPSYKLEE